MSAEIHHSISVKTHYDYWRPLAEPFENFNMRLEYLLPFFINNDNTSLTSFPCMNERITPSSSFVISSSFGQIDICKGSKFFVYATYQP